MSAVRNRPADGNNAAARTFLALQQTPPDRIPLVLRDCLDTIRRTQRVLEALTEQLRWDGETLRVTLRRVDCK